MVNKYTRINTELLLLLLRFRINSFPDFNQTIVVENISFVLYLDRISSNAVCPSYRTLHNSFANRSCVCLHILLSRISAIRSQLLRLCMWIKMSSGSMSVSEAEKKKKTNESSHQLETITLIYRYVVHLFLFHFFSVSQSDAVDFREYSISASTVTDRLVCVDSWMRGEEQRCITIEESNSLFASISCLALLFAYNLLAEIFVGRREFSLHFSLFPSHDEIHKLWFVCPLSLSLYCCSFLFGKMNFEHLLLRRATKVKLKLSCYTRVVPTRVYESAFRLIYSIV